MSKNIPSSAPKGQGDAASGAAKDADKLQEQLAQVIAERDTLAAQLAEALAKLQAAAAAAPAKSSNEGAGTHVRVCSKSPGGSHRRAGRVWTTEPQDVPLADLSNEQLAQLRGCPLTIVVDL